MDVFYQNNLGERISFDRFPIVIQNPEKLFCSEWSYSSERGSERTRITEIYKDKTEKTVELSVFADTKEEFNEIVENLQNIAEKDVVAGTPGKLFINDYYLECYFISRDYSDFEELFYSVEIKAKVVAENSLWIKKTKYTYNNSIVKSKNNKKYPGKYPQRYANNVSDQSIINANVRKCNFEMTMYGPALNPSVEVGNHKYTIHATLEEGEKLIIDSSRKTVKKYSAENEEEDAFDLREKRESVFEKIEPGVNKVTWSGRFNFDLAVFEERAEPVWY